VADLSVSRSLDPLSHSQTPANLSAAKEWINRIPGYFMRRIPIFWLEHHQKGAIPTDIE
jgi:hypothetical protein